MCISCSQASGANPGHESLSWPPQSPSVDRGPHRRIPWKRDSCDMRQPLDLLPCARPVSTIWSFGRGHLRSPPQCCCCPVRAAWVVHYLRRSSSHDCVQVAEICLKGMNSQVQRGRRGEYEKALLQPTSAASCLPSKPRLPHVPRPPTCGCGHTRPACSPPS